MHHSLDLSRHPIDRLDSGAGRDLVSGAKAALQAEGMFSLPGLVRPHAIADVVAEVEPLFATASFNHARRHNIYFKREIAGLDPDHPALTEFETVNHTVCADQIQDSTLLRVYRYRPLIDFLARVMAKPELYCMADPLACVNVMEYRTGEALNWHFDRAEFTTTLLLQAPDQGGEFEYARDLRSDTDPNYDGVARLVRGERPVDRLRLEPGTLNVFLGRNTAHRVTPVQGATPRIIAVFSYYEQPEVSFSAEERIGFYGRPE